MSGAFVVGDRPSLLIMQIVMFTHAMRTRHFYKTTSVLRLLSMLYSTEFSVQEQYRWAAIAFARNAVVQILSYWLGIARLDALSSACDLIAMRCLQRYLAGRQRLRAARIESCQRSSWDRSGPGRRVRAPEAESRVRGRPWPAPRGP